MILNPAPIRPNKNWNLNSFLNFWLTFEVEKDKIGNVSLPFCNLIIQSQKATLSNFETNKKSLVSQFCSIWLVKQNYSITFWEKLIFTRMTPLHVSYQVNDINVIKEIKLTKVSTNFKRIWWNTIEPRTTLILGQEKSVYFENSELRVII